CNVACNNNNGNVTASLGTLTAGSSSTVVITASAAYVATQTAAVATGSVSTTTTQISNITNQTTLNVTLNPPAGPPSGNVLTLLPNPSDPNSYLAGTNGGGVFRSMDGGVNWIPVNGGLTGLFVRWLVRDPSNASIVYAGTNFGVFKSSNGGNSWIQLNSGL